MKPPRKGADLLAQGLDVSPKTAERYIRELPRSDDFAELDHRLRAEAALADLEAAESINDHDVAAAALQDDPVGALTDEIAQRSDRQLLGRLGAHVSWANTADRSARTEPARSALEAKFLAEAGGDPIRAEHLRKAYYLRLALKSAQARRRRKGAL